MHPATRSMKYFGVYVLVNGTGLMFAPALALAPLGLAAPTEVWIRVLGAVVIVLGYYYWSCAQAEALAFYHASIRGRILFAALSVVIVVAFNAPPQLLLFAVIDVLGAAWTAMGLRSSQSQDSASVA